MSQQLRPGFWHDLGIYVRGVLEEWKTRPPKTSRRVTRTRGEQKRETLLFVTRSKARELAGLKSIRGELSRDIEKLVDAQLANAEVPPC